MIKKFTGTHWGGLYQNKTILLFSHKIPLSPHFFPNQYSHHCTINVTKSVILKTLL